MAQHHWIEKNRVLAIHGRQLAEHGGLAGVRDEGVLDTALARPLRLASHGGAGVDIPALAAACASGIARDRPFLEGNQPTALVTCELFLDRNGFTLNAGDVEIYRTFLALADGTLTEDALAAWLREHAAPVPPE